MNFQFVENTFELDLHNFVEEYNKRELYVYEIRDKFGWSEHYYLKLRNEAVKRGLVSDVRYKCKKHQPKHYYYHTTLERYCVLKTISQERVYFGSYSTENEAQQVIQMLKECNWDKKHLRRIQKCIKSEKI